MTEKSGNETITIGLLKDLSEKGWKYTKTLKNDVKDELHIIGILGGDRKGKSFLLQKLKINQNIEQNNQSFTAYYHSLLNEKDKLSEVFLKSPGKKLYEVDSKEKKTEDIEVINCEDNEAKKLVEDFIIDNSSIIIYMMGVETLHDLRTINRIKNKLQRKQTTKLILIHNFPDFTIDDIYNFMNNNHYCDNNTNRKLMNFNCFRTTLKDDQDPTKTYIELYSLEKIDFNEHNSSTITHLFFGKDDNIINRLNINFLFNLLGFSLEKERFNLRENFCKYLEENYEKYFDLPNEPTKIESNENTIKIFPQLKSHYHYETINEFKLDVIYPNYSYYYTKKEFILEIVSGFESIVTKTNLQIELDNYVLSVEGTKKVEPEEPFEGNIEKGNFFLNLYLPIQNGLFTSKKANITYNDGIITLKFNLLKLE